MATIYRCTECDAEYKSFDKAARCHWGIGGVEEVEDTPLHYPGAAVPIPPRGKS
jgi:hypothetical protein